MLPSSPAEAKGQLRPSPGPEGQPPSGRGSEYPLSMVLDHLVFLGEIISLSKGALIRALVTSVPRFPPLACDITQIHKREKPCSFS
jgi:hypothetical protein